ncbi:membrane protein insertion efficiency factor YidD [Candidatus Uabimicrobium amorphum]|uniref:Membrane protein insertion efficiency factor YidD n=1 Tax=Uabimicrobium amorphum TaxID=2596890 RepID=A0A5S9F6D1_UABAM|nr:membrane protein insertion efficiency factor YidD [Candidatus Uabimicrobium amorphum]BBM86142.1 hypothetical protein UABAM_04528 [Candidatus Uabimicrobium amorphum]
MKTLAIHAINGYQKYISPYKGFCCAHRVLHGLDSCSEYAKKTVAQNGVYNSIKKIRQRFAACRQANMLLMEEKKKSTKDHIRMGLYVMDRNCDMALRGCEIFNCCSFL